MKTRFPPSTKLILPVAYALLCVALAIGVYTKFGGSVPFAPQGYRVTLPLPDASNLYPGSPVQVAGVPVGKVIAVRRARGHTDASLELQPQIVPLRTGATAIVRTKSLLGEGYIELAPGSPTAPAIPDGGSLAASRVQPTQTLDDVLETFSPPARRNLRALFTGIGSALNGRAGAVNDSLAYAAPVTANFASVTQTLQGQEGTLQHLIANAGQVLNAVGERSQTLQSAVANGNSVLNVTALRNRELAATVKALPPFLRALSRTSHGLAGASADLNGAVSALTPVTPLLAPALIEANASLPALRSVFVKLPRTISAGKAGLPGLTRIVRAARPALQQVYPALRQAIPLLQILGRVRSSVVALFANVGSIFNGVSIAPGGLPIHTLSAVPAVWNETPSGWVKRLPTNRLNPYPEPGSALNIAHGGLKAYDCRNIHNILYLPATGTGSPPCITQGPWTFDGVSRYYPHLTEAPP